jgi:ribosome-associated protein
MPPPPPPPNPSSADCLEITRTVCIPVSELTYRAVRSGGPGGQHVNRSATKVELWWNARTSASLTEAQRARVLDRLGSRLDARGRLRLTASASRSQKQNRERVTQRFQVLLAAALRPRKPRKKTAVPQRVKRARLQDKRRRAKLKAQRRKPTEED